MDCARRNKVGCYTVARDVAEPTKNKYLNFAIIAAETESSIILSEYPVAKKNPPHRIFWYYYTRLVQVDSLHPCMASIRGRGLLTNFVGPPPPPTPSES